MSKLVIEHGTVENLGDAAVWAVEKEVEVTSEAEALGLLVRDLVETADVSYSVDVIQEWVLNSGKPVTVTNGHQALTRFSYVAE